MFFSVQLRLGNECDFHGMLELARTVLVNLCECCESRYQKKECSVLPMTQQTQRTSEGALNGPRCCSAGLQGCGGTQKAWNKKEAHPRGLGVLKRELPLR